jgi:hypothetical protein
MIHAQVTPLKNWSVSAVLLNKRQHALNGNIILKLGNSYYSYNALSNLVFESVSDEVDCNIEDYLDVVSKKPDNLKVYCFDDNTYESCRHIRKSSNCFENSGRDFFLNPNNNRVLLNPQLYLLKNDTECCLYDVRNKLSIIVNNNAVITMPDEITVGKVKYLDYIIDMNVALLANCHYHNHSEVKYKPIGFPKKVFLLKTDQTSDPYRTLCKFAKPNMYNIELYMHLRSFLSHKLILEIWANLGTDFNCCDIEPKYLLTSFGRWVMDIGQDVLIKNEKIPNMYNLDAYKKTIKCGEDCKELICFRRNDCTVSYSTECFKDSKIYIKAHCYNAAEVVDYKNNNKVFIHEGFETNLVMGYDEDLDSFCYLNRASLSNYNYSVETMMSLWYYNTKKVRKVYSLKQHVKVNPIITNNTRHLAALKACGFNFIRNYNKGFYRECLRTRDKIQAKIEYYRNNAKMTVEELNDKGSKILIPKFNTTMSVNEATVCKMYLPDTEHNKIVVDKLLFQIRRTTMVKKLEKIIELLKKGIIKDNYRAFLDHHIEIPAVVMKKLQPANFIYKNEVVKLKTFKVKPTFASLREAALRESGMVVSYKRLQVPSDWLEISRPNISLYTGDKIEYNYYVYLIPNSTFSDNNWYTVKRYNGVRRKMACNIRTLADKDISVTSFRYFKPSSSLQSINI